MITSRRLHYSRYDPECVADNLRDKVDRLQDISDKQREYFESILFIQNKDGSYKYAAACEIAIKALALTVTDKENG